MNAVVRCEATTGEGTAMSDLSITVAAYDDLARAQIDWDLLEVAGDADSILEGLGDAAGTDEVAIVVVTDPASVTALPGLLFNAIRLDTKAGGDADHAPGTLDAPGAPRAGRTRT